MMMGRSTDTAGVGDREMTDGQRKTANLVRVGKVEAADYGAARIRVRVGDAANPTGHIVTDWIPWLTPRAGKDRAWWAPEVGETVVLLSPGGETRNAVALPASFSDAAPAPADRETVHRTIYEDGTMVEYDRAEHRLTLDVQGDIVIRATGTIRLEAARIDLN